MTAPIATAAALARTDWRAVSPALLDAGLAADRLRAALDASPELAPLLAARFAYASAARLAFPAGPLPHADLHERLLGVRVQGDRLRRRGGLEQAEEIHARLVATGGEAGPAGAIGDHALFAALDASLAAQAEGHPLPSLAALPVLARAGLLPDPPPPVAWAMPDPDASVRERTLAALRSQTEAFERARRTTEAAGTFVRRAHTALRGAGLRSTNAAFRLAVALAGQPVLTAGNLPRSVGVSATAFHAAMPGLEALGLARELTARAARRAWAAADADLTPDFRLPGERPVPPKADRLAAADPLDLASHDAAARDALLLLDGIVQSEDT